MKFESRLKDLQDKINSAIQRYLLAPSTHPTLIHQAMHYSMNAPGKRLRPLLLIAAHELFSSDTDPYPASVAIECIHTYSLIHDDLPSMDNSDLRRGLPTSHKKFDEATAILTGDALLTYAFNIISHEYKNIPAIACELIQILSDAAGSEKLIGGQIEDFYASKSNPSKDKLQFIHQNKTAAMMIAAITMGLALNNASNENIKQAKELGTHLGLAFQIIDDILDETSPSQSTGKPHGIDLRNQTLTYPSLYGIKTSRDIAQEHSAKAQSLCTQIGGNNRFLSELINHLGNRVA